MNKYTRFTFILAIILVFFTANSPVFAEAPYYTYTSDSEGEIIRTQSAYTPMNQLSVINGEKLQMLEHVFVDDQDDIYISDSAHNKVFILDSNLTYKNELVSDKFSSVKSTFVTDEHIYVVDSMEAKIFIFDKQTLQFIREIAQPESPVFNEGYTFSPTNIAVDIRGNMYVRSNGSINGLIMLNRDGEFITFFGANPLKVPFLDQIRSVFLTKEQEKKMEKIFPDVPSNIAIDEKGFIYTVTSSIETNPVKKFNVSGTNYFPDEMVGTFTMESVWVGQHNNVYAVSSDGWIFEYDSKGDLLFLFGGKDFSSSRFGLLNRPISIASNSKDELIVIDQGQNTIQTYQSTKFADTVHQAMGAYQAGEYNKSKDLWEYTLKYNSIFDNAHIGLGDSFLREGDHNRAYEEYVETKYNKGVSEAFWEIRQGWLKNNLSNVFTLLILLMVLVYTYKFLNRRYSINAILSKRMSIVSKIKVISDLMYIFTFLKKPLDGLYDIQRENRVAKKSSTVIYMLIIGVFIFQHQFTSSLFMEENEYFLYKLSIMIFLFVLWLISNYLVSSITDGEGTFTHVYKGTAYAISPILVIIPLLVIFSNGLTLEQSVFYHLPIQVMFLWILFLMFFMIKDMQNYSVGETLSVVSKTLFTMLIIGLFLFVLYSVGSQLISFMLDVVTEVGKRW
ncbi:MAG: hypothetical protein AB2392_02705 [Neobacillus sp.]